MRRAVSPVAESSIALISAHGRAPSWSKIVRGRPQVLAGMGPAAGPTKAPAVRQLGAGGLEHVRGLRVPGQRRSNSLARVRRRAPVDHGHPGRRASAHGCPWFSASFSKRPATFNACRGPEGAGALDQSRAPATGPRHQSVAVAGHGCSARGGRAPRRADRARARGRRVQRSTRSAEDPGPAPAGAEGFRGGVPALASRSPVAPRPTPVGLVRRRGRSVARSPGEADGLVKGGVGLRPPIGRPLGRRRRG